MKKNNPDKLKKAHIYPLIIILLIVVLIVGVAIILIAGAIFDNMTRGKISQGYKWAHGFYSQIKDININDKSALDDAFINYSNVVNDVTGVTIKDGENVIYKNGEEISDLKINANEYSHFSGKEKWKMIWREL